MLAQFCWISYLACVDVYQKALKIGFWVMGQTHCGGRACIAGGHRRTRNAAYLTTLYSLKSRASKHKIQRIWISKSTLKKVSIKVFNENSHTQCEYYSYHIIISFLHLLMHFKVLITIYTQTRFAPRYDLWVWESAWNPRKYLEFPLSARVSHTRMQQCRFDNAPGAQNLGIAGRGAADCVRASRL